MTQFASNLLAGVAKLGRRRRIARLVMFLIKNKRLICAANGRFGREREEEGADRSLPRRRGLRRGRCNNFAARGGENSRRHVVAGIFLSAASRGTVPARSVKIKFHHRETTGYRYGTRARVLMGIVTCASAHTMIIALSVDVRDGAKGWLLMGLF